MHKPRLIHYNDAHHFHAKRIEPPASLHMLQWPVDEIAGTGADTLVLGLGYGDVYFHDSKVDRVVGQRQETWSSYIDWRIMRMVEEGRRLGTDQLRACVERGRELGVHVYPSLKLQDTARPEAERCGLLKWEHGADICIGEEGRYLFGYDFAHDIVREHKLTVLKEVLDNYRPDGLELDFMFDLRFFKAGEEEHGAGCMTEFMAALRQLMDTAAAEQGRDRIPLMARVSLDEARNRGVGLDVTGWLQAGYLDHVAGQDERVLTDSEPKPAWLPEAANATGGNAYYRPPRRVYHEAVGFLHIEMWRALQHSLVRGGWAGLYHGYMPWPFDEVEHAFLREMGFPETTIRRDKRYFLQPREGAMDTATTTPDRVLPAPLQAGETVRAPIHVADDVAAARADGEMRKPVLTLRFSYFCIEDDFEIRFNGQVLDPSDMEATDERALFFPVRFHGGQAIQAPEAGSFHWFRFRLNSELVHTAENLVEVEMKRLDPRATFARALSGVELHMRYRDMQRPFGLDVSRVSPKSS